MTLTVQVRLDGYGMWGERLPSNMRMVTIAADAIGDMHASYSHTEIVQLSEIDSALSVAFERAQEHTRKAFREVGFKPQIHDAPK